MKNSVLDHPVTPPSYFAVTMEQEEAPLEYGVKNKPKHHSSKPIGDMQIKGATG